MLNIVKVLQRPTEPAPNTLYFEKSAVGNTFSIYMTDATATVVDVDVFSNGQIDIVDVLGAIINQPNGIAGLDATKTLSSVVQIHGQDNLITDGAGDYVWQDLIASFQIKGSSGSNPSFGTFIGNFQGLLFASGNMEQVWCDFHICHDHALDTYLFPHIHWAPTTNQSGTVRWGIEYMVAKGHQRQKFSNPVTVYVNQTVPSNSLGLHCIAEVSPANAIPATNVEPDTFIKIRVFRDAASSQDTYPSDAHAWACDLHYQIARFGTVNKAPDFFGGTP